MLADELIFNSWVINDDKVLVVNDSLTPVSIHISQPDLLQLPQFIQLPPPISDRLTFSHVLLPQSIHCTDNSNHDLKEIISTAKPQIAPNLAINLQEAISLNILDKDFIQQRLSMVSIRQLINQQPIEVIHSLTKAIQMLRWQHDNKFCGRCGGKCAVHPVEKNAMVCQQCGFIQYPRVQPCIIVAITRTNPCNNKSQVLLAHHTTHYKKNDTAPRYGLIAGFVEAGETLEDAVRREVKEETNLTIDNINYITSQPWPYPSNLMVGFFADYISGNILVQQEEIIHADFFDIDDLPNIPPTGTIANQLIEKLVNHHNIDMPESSW